MKAAIVSGDGTIEVADIPLPERGEYDCLVRMEACALCNSTDRHLVDGTLPMKVDYPAVWGHESVGTVVELGPKARSFSVGARVLRVCAVYPPDDMLGPYYSAWGGFAEFGKILDWRAMVEDGAATEDEVIPIFRKQQLVPPSIEPTHATLMIPQKEMYMSTAAMAPVAGRRFLVAGAGITAFLFGTYLRMQGAAHVTMTARRTGPLEFAQQHGAADDTCRLDELDRIATDYDALVETTGSMDVAVRLLEKIKPGGHVYAYAIYDNMADDAIYDPLRRNHKCQRVDPNEAAAHEVVCDLIAAGKLDAGSLITHVFPFADIHQAWQTVTTKQTFKTVVCF